jgi:hypothetical protein
VCSPQPNLAPRLGGVFKRMIAKVLDLRIHDGADRILPSLYALRQHQGL